MKIDEDHSKSIKIDESNTKIDENRTNFEED